MKLEEFKILVENRYKECTSLMYGSKNEEYTRNDDKLHNFKRAGDVLNTFPEWALAGMWAKHIVSVLDILDDIAEGKKIPKDLLSEKMNDNHNYLFLLEALIEDEHPTSHCLIKDDK